MVIFSLLTLAFAPSTKAFSSSSCIEQVSSQINSLQSALDVSRAVSLATSSPKLQVAERGYSSSYGFISNNWSWDSNCRVTWEKVNVVFTLSNSTGFVGYASAVEDPALTSVTTVTLQGGPPSQGQEITTSWAGYQFAGNADNTVSVWETIGQFTVPKAQPPTQGCSNYCFVIIWTGLTHDTTGTYIVQAGNEDIINSLGGVDYELGYEFYPTYNWYNCFPMGWYGDTVSVYVINQDVNPGGNSALYNIQVFDLTQNQGCTPVAGFNFGVMGIPHYGNFIVEAAAIPHTQNLYTLADFDPFSLTGNMYYSGSTRGIYTPYTNGWYTTITMQPCTTCPAEVQTGAVSSSNSFTSTWVYSAT